MTLDVQIERNSTTLSAQVHVSGRTPGLRKIEAVRCEGLSDALAVTIAMILDQEARDALEARNEGAPLLLPDGSGAAKAKATAEDVDVQPSTKATAAQEAASSSATTSNHSTTAPASNSATAASPNPAASSTAPVAAMPPVASRPTQSQQMVGGKAFSRATPLSADSTGLVTADTAALHRVPDQDLRAWLGAGTGSSNRYHLELGGEYSVRGWALQLGAFLDPPHQQSLSTGTLETITLGGLLAGCNRIGTEFRFVPCARVGLGMERVNGQGFDENNPPRQLTVFSMGPSVGVETGRRWILGLDLLGLFGFPQRTYEAQNWIDRRTSEVKSPTLVLWLVARVAYSSNG